MPGPSPTQKIAELTQVVDRHAVQLGSLEAALDRETERREAAARRQEERNEAVNRALEALRTENALLRQKLDDQVHRTDEWGRRLWALAGPLVGAAAGALVTYLVKR